MSRSYSRGKSGVNAIVKVNLPRFNYQHIQRESLFVEQALQTQQYSQDVDARALTQSIINQKNQEQVEQIQNEKLHQFHELREKLTTAHGMFSKRVVMKSQNSRRPRASSRAGYDQPMTNVTIPVGWIDSHVRPGVTTGLSRPARDPVKIERFMQSSAVKQAQLVPKALLASTRDVQTSYAQQRLPLRSQQQQVLSQDSISRQRGHASMYQESQGAEEAAEDFEDDFGLLGLNTNKTLKNYDCWDESQTPYELVSSMRDDPGYHAKCPHYTRDKRYVWTPVQVIGYDEEGEKYMVRVIENNTVKYVGRLSLMMKNESEKNFKARLLQCKHLQKQAEDELRFYRYVDSLDDGLVATLPEWQLKRIVEAIRRSKRKAAKKRRGTALTSLGQDSEDYFKNQNVKKLKDGLLEQAELEYRLFMKKYLVMLEMELPYAEPKFRELRIQPRFMADYMMKVPPRRLIVHANFRQVCDIIRDVPYLANSNVTESLFNVTFKANRQETFKLFMTDFHSGQLPLPLDIFEDQLRKNHHQAKQNMLSQWRSFLIQEVQDILRNVYSFYQTESNQYESSELSRLLKKIDFMFRTYTEESVLHLNIHQWVDFIKCFNAPTEGLSSPWRMWEWPILYLNLTVNLNVRKKKQTKKKGEVVKEDDEETIFFEPSLYAVKAALCRPLEMIVQTITGMQGLEKDLVPLVNIKSQGVLEVSAEHPLIVRARATIEAYIDEGFQEPKQVLESFRQFSLLFEKSNSQMMKRMFGDPKEKPTVSNLDLEEITRNIFDYQRAKHEIEKLCIDEKTFSFFQVRTKVAKEALTQKASEILGAILTRSADIVTDNITRITQAYQDMCDRMLSSPKNEIELVELKNFIAETEVNLAKIRNEVDCVLTYLDLFEKVSHPYSEKNIEYLSLLIGRNFWYLKSWPQEIRIALIEGQRNTSVQEQKFTEKLDYEKEVFAGELLDLQAILEQIKRFDQSSMVKENATEVMGLRDRLDKAQDKVRSFNERENLFKQPLSDYEDLNKVLTTFEPYHKLWDIAMEFDLDKQDWYQGNFLRLTYPPIERKINQYYMKEILRLQKFFQDLDDERASKVIKELRADVERFREKMWLIELLTTEAMTKKPATWKEIFRECGVTEIESEEMTFQGLLDVGMQQFRDRIEDISKRADKQWSIEKKLNELVEKLKEAKVEFLPYGTTGTSILRYVDEIQQLLDDQLNILLMMKASPFIRAVINKANTIEQKIILIQDTMEGWIKTQRGWMYLEPIFSSDDIKKKLPREKEKFDQIDKNWRATVEQFIKEPFLWEAIDTDKYKLEFDTNNKLLEEIQKSLSEYLETKRRFFPRFFFLSDEELLEILAQTKDPLTVQKHINKCFEAINQLYFQEGSPDEDGKVHMELVTQMISPEKETVRMIRPINVNEGEKRGNVERWLSEIEQVMVETLRRLTLDSIKDTETPRPEWIKRWPGQCVLAIAKLRWTGLVEQTIVAQNDQSAAQETEGPVFPSLQHLDQFLQRQMMEETVKLLYQQNLDDLTRVKVNSLIVLDVHSRDIVTDLAKKEYLTTQSFDWLAQLRYNWVQEPKKIGTLKVRMVNADVAYGFEYLGNSGRLVITPLTDRCYRTLMGAFLMNYGGAPEGPAGTGKTETVKDLAKALAVQCVVFNCSDGLNYLAMSKFFKGLASSGAWCCFDEFNRIDLEVLSVIAQQVLTIQTAIKEKKRIFFFDGDEYVLVPSCSINITMNPGYAGRSELPDNLKALFRPCAMMVPDYKLIAGIYLVSVGFKQAKVLSVKIVACLKLSSEQLSSQDHYDFGMRALKAMLTAAGNLKRTYQDENEDILCLRALMDVNVPKFTQNDIPLFLSITSDLFPLVKLPPADNLTLIEALTAQCQQLKLQPKQSFLEKCIQLYDTINVRHGLMNVGQAFSGKSKVLECLQKAMTSLTGQQGFVPVMSYKLNPKAVTSDQLYGKLDPDTKSWSDGVIAIIMRECARDQDLREKKWIVFDGPVDAVWIENMNTVLDDNKKLCLTSGEIIKMTTHMTMMFEVADLAVASPATVSRCGMVYMEPDGLGWCALVESFADTWKDTVLQPYQETLLKRLKWLIDTSLAWLRRHGGPYCYPIYHSDMTSTKNILQLLRAFTDDYLQEGTKLPKDLEDPISSACLFATVWGLGGVIHESIRKPYNELLQRMITAASDIPEAYKLILDYPFEPQAVHVKVPDTHQTKEKPSLYDLLYDKQKNQWVPWTATQPNFIVQKNTPYSELIVPTNDLIRNNFLLHLCVRQRLHLLVCGPTGTGKTTNMVNEINKYYFNKDFTNLQTSFSGQTTANQVQRTIEGKINSRRRKGYFGPEEGKKCCVIFIDDLNMPTKEIFGAQPPIELLRQWMDVQGWYDLETKEFKHLQDIVFVAAMLPPQGGRNVVTLRYLRHYVMQYAQPFDNDSLNRIFGTVVEWFLMNLGASQAVPKSVTTIANQLVGGTIELYNRLQNTKELLPTPAKSHYVYNLRDISKVFQGVSKVDLRGVHSDNDLVKVWAHECQRVFQDRLITMADQLVLQALLKDIVSLNLKRDWEQLVEVEPLIFASFVPYIYPDGDTTKRPYNDVYCELPDRDLLRKQCEDQLNEYNSFFPHNRMQLVLFMSAIEHIVRIVRVLQTSYGHLLLVGVGGSGRKSLAQISSFIALQNETCMVDQRQWIEELQRLCRVVGVDGKSTAFVLMDSQILYENMLEQICNLLNNGEVPNLYPAEEKSKLIEDLSNIIVSGTPQEKYQEFVKRCKTNLHVVLCMSPVGETFRQRLRTFPALVNCTTIDWFLEWPREALQSTAEQFISTRMQLNNGLEEEQYQQLFAGLVQVAVDMQERVKDLTIRFLAELRCYYYVTPTSYLELLNTFKTLVEERTASIVGSIQRYRSGVEKILATESDVSKMKKVLEDLQPKLERATIENSHMLINLQKKQKEADAKKQMCELEEKECNVKREEANLLRNDCQQELDKVLPLLAAAGEALDKIGRDDMVQLKSFTNPPPAAAIVMEGVCYTFNEDQFVKWKPKEAGSIEKVQDFWEYAKRALLNDKLIKRVKDFKEDQIRSIPQAKINKLKNFVQNPMFEREKVFNASKAAGNLSLWIRAVIDTYEALLVVDPKREQLKVAEQNLREAEAILAEKKAALQEVLDFLYKLEQDYQVAKREKEELEAEVNRCKIQLDRAEKLIQGLGGEKDSWRRKAEESQAETRNIIGDCMLSSGIIAYLGAFPSGYRETAIAAWKDLLIQLRIPFLKDFQLQRVLSDPITIGQWTNQQRLPNDSFSIDNAIILKNSNRWPLMIDPQTQANQWIKVMENYQPPLGERDKKANKHGRDEEQNFKKKLILLKTSSPNQEILMTLENSIQLGYSVLLEGLGETIPNVYEPVLQKKIVKQGGVLRIKFGERMLDYNSDFRFYMTTKLGRPHYSPEVCVQVTMLNFQVTQEGLEDQMLNIVVKQEEPAKEEQRQKNIKDFYENKNKQKMTEDLILKLLNEAQGNLLDDELLIVTLQKSKIESMEIEEKLKKQEHDREVFNAIRNSYVEVAKRVSQVYFVMLDLALIEPTYQWSLEFYISLFEKSIQEAQQGKEHRCLNIIDKFQQLLYDSVCRSLLEKDKIIFSFLLQLKILAVEGNITAPEVRLMMIGVSSTEPTHAKPEAWVSNKVWCGVCELTAKLEAFAGFDVSFIEDIDLWKIYVQNDEPQLYPLPGKWEQQLNSFQKLIVLRIMRPDKVVPGIQRLVSNNMGAQFIDPPPFNLEASYLQSDASTPLIFILSPGADPRLEIQLLADKFGLKNNLEQLSLGQGQGAAAERAIIKCIEEGKWVLLQNCHLAKSFMPELERIYESMIAQLTHEDSFRIWLTTAPSDVFPVSLLQRGIKMTFEPPRGIRNNLLRVYLAQDPKKFEESQKPYEYKKLLFGLAFFHALLLERRKYGPLGWNVPYEFTQADFNISQQQLKVFLDDYQEIPWDALNYLVAETNYGGRVTDPKDRRLIKIMLNDFYDPQILLETYRFSPSGNYYAPNDGSLQTYVDFVRDLPINDPTEVFGLHSNAEITSAILETNQICGTILGLLPRTSGPKGRTTEETIKDISVQILQQLPPPFNLEEISRKHPVEYENSMNTVLQQELIRFNKLLGVIRESITNVMKAIEGLIVMSSDLEQVGIGLFDNILPALWQKVSYPSLKPLQSYINDLIDRLKFMQDWAEHKAPVNFWVSGFFFTQSFLTGVSQNYARKHHIPIDTLQFIFDFKRFDQQYIQQPEDGCYIYGLFFDGGRWDDNTRCVRDSEPYILNYPVPTIHLVPTQDQHDIENDLAYYECPVYKTSRRAGTLSTTGHSTNFVLSIYTPIREHPRHWVKRGLAMLTQLND